MSRASNQKSLSIVPMPRKVGVFIPSKTVAPLSNVRRKYTNTEALYTKAIRTPTKRNSINEDLINLGKVGEDIISGENDVCKEETFSIDTSDR